MNTVMKIEKILIQNIKTGKQWIKTAEETAQMFGRLTPKLAMNYARKGYSTCGYTFDLIEVEDEIRKN